jgi:hypothetical protein
MKLTYIIKLCQLILCNLDVSAIEQEELNEFKTYDEENYDNDSCYNCLEENELYCEFCIKQRFSDLKIYNSIKQDHPDLL